MKIKKYARITGEARELLSADVVYRYKKGASIRTIAEDHGRSYGAIHYMLSQAGVELRSRGGYTSPRRGRR